MFSSPRGSVCVRLRLLSHVWNSWTHRSSLLIKAIKAFCYFCSYSLVPGFLSLSAVCIIIFIEPTCELEARLGGNYIGLAREKRGGGQRNGRPFGQSPQLPFAFSVAAVVVPEAGGTTAAAPLKAAVSVCLITCRDNIEKDRCYSWRAGKAKLTQQNCDCTADLTYCSLWNTSRIRRTYLVLAAYCWMMWWKVGNARISI